MREADLSNADLRGADLEGAVLDRAHFDGARLSTGAIERANQPGTLLGKANVDGTDREEVFR